MKNRKNWSFWAHFFRSLVWLLLTKIAIGCEYFRYAYTGKYKQDLRKLHTNSLWTIEIDILYTLEEVLIIEFYCLLVHERGVNFVARNLTFWCKKRLIVWHAGSTKTHAVSFTSHVLTSNIIFLHFLWFLTLIKSLKT